MARSKEDTAAFLQRMNERNEVVAAQDAQIPLEDRDLDPIREQRDAERREKYGPMRARKGSGLNKRKAGNYSE